MFFLKKIIEKAVQKELDNRNDIIQERIKKEFGLVRYHYWPIPPENIQINKELDEIKEKMSLICDYLGV